MENFILGFAIGIVALILFINWMANRFINQITSQHARVSKFETVIEAKVEEINGVYFVWSVKDNSFLAQGKNLDELKNHIDRRWNVPNINIKILQGDEGVIKALKTSKNS